MDENKTEATLTISPNEEQTESDKMVPAFAPSALNGDFPAIGIFGFIVTALFYFSGIVMFVMGKGELDRYRGDAFHGYTLIAGAFSCWISGVIIHLLSSIAIKVSLHYELTKMEMASRRVKKPKS